MSSETEGIPIESEPDPKLRLFVAVPLWDDFRERNRHYYVSLKKLSLDLKWVKPENWHITLKFLGPVPQSQVTPLVNSLGEHLKGVSPITFELAGLGGFPRLSKCRVLWVGATKGRKELNTLARKVAEACREAGTPGDRKNFQAHLTLARSRNNPLAIKVSDELFRSNWGSETVDSVALVKSTLGPGGAKYEIVETIRF
ncbi:MAG: RNA 2',3'-cyclic phosphodiesterase [Candidatus Omnitrophica bacterium]|nr:RNA 2',3'-cyclic phosphodiesterase [Candidatus Omnitrophota bacterium]